MFVCLFVCLLTGLFFYFNHLGTPTEIYPENFVKIPLDLAEILRIRKLDWKMFICLFVCLFVYIFIFFCFNHRRVPKGSFAQHFVKMGLDLAEILRISKLDWRDRGGEGSWLAGKEGTMTLWAQVLTLSRFGMHPARFALRVL